MRDRLSTAFASFAGSIFLAFSFVVLLLYSDVASALSSYPDVYSKVLGESVLAALFALLLFAGVVMMMFGRRYSLIGSVVCFVSSVAGALNALSFSVTVTEIPGVVVVAQPASYGLLQFMLVFGTIITCFAGLPLGVAAAMIREHPPKGEPVEQAMDGPAAQ